MARRSSGDQVACVARRRGLMTPKPGGASGWGNQVNFSLDLAEIFTGLRQGPATVRTGVDEGAKAHVVAPHHQDRHVQNPDRLVAAGIAHFSAQPQHKLLPDGFLQGLAAMKHFVTAEADFPVVG